MVLERFRHRAPMFLDPVVRALQRLRISPNAVSSASLLFALAAGITFGFASASSPILLIAGAVLVAVNAVLDAVDGRLARVTFATTRRGDYLDHVFDRYADAAILVGLSFSPLGNMTFGILAIAGTLLTSYMGTQAQALGLGRDYSGLLGRADRLVLLFLIPLLEYARVVRGVSPIYGFTLIAWLLLYFGIVGNFTAIQRFAKGWSDLGKA
ncbi:MAG: CDP-alcohol phosphatidyltransferase family protein [Thermoplasmatota archaeon]